MIWLKEKLNSDLNLPVNPIMNYSLVNALEVVIKKVKNQFLEYQFILLSHRSVKPLFMINLLLLSEV